MIYWRISRFTGSLEDVLQVCRISLGDLRICRGTLEFTGGLNDFCGISGFTRRFEDLLGHFRILLADLRF